jgi:hypothetical protein
MQIEGGAVLLFAWLPDVGWGLVTQLPNPLPNSQACLIDLSPRVLILKSDASKSQPGKFREGERVRALSLRLVCRHVDTLRMKAVLRLQCSAVGPQDASVVVLRRPLVALLAGVVLPTPDGMADVSETAS